VYRRRQLSSLLSSFYLATLFALCFLATGCASDADLTAGWSTDKLYEEAKEMMENKSYEKAIGYYEKLEGRAAGTTLAQQAQLEKAFAQFKNGEPALAVSTLDRFIKLNPSSPALDYAFYLKGVVNFNDDLGFFSRYFNQDLSERDQKAAKQSFEAFKEVVSRFPDSKYAPDASLRMRFIINTLAKSEVVVAKYYFKKGAYVAAINRAKSAINDYQDVPVIEEALIIMIKSYEILGLQQLKEDTVRVLQQSYPNSEYFGRKTQKSSNWFGLLSK
jgi:outer membrane protein assembly factor BamD